MAENFSKLMPETKPQIQEAQRTLSRINAKNLHLGISFQPEGNQRERKILKEAGGKKCLTYGITKIRIKSNLSETM